MWKVRVDRRQTENANSADYVVVPRSRRRTSVPRSADEYRFPLIIKFADFVSHAAYNEELNVSLLRLSLDSRFRVFDGRALTVFAFDSDQNKNFPVKRQEEAQCVSHQLCFKCGDSGENRKRAKPVEKCWNSNENSEGTQAKIRSAQIVRLQHIERRGRNRQTHIDRESIFSVILILGTVRTRRSIFRQPIEAADAILSSEERLDVKSAKSCKYSKLLDRSGRRRKAGMSDRNEKWSAGERSKRSKREKTGKQVYVILFCSSYAPIRPAYESLTPSAAGDAAATAPTVQQQKRKAIEWKKTIEARKYFDFVLDPKQ